MPRGFLSALTQKHKNSFADLAYAALPQHAASDRPARAQADAEMVEALVHAVQRNRRQAACEHDRKRGAEHWGVDDFLDPPRGFARLGLNWARADGVTPLVAAAEAGHANLVAHLIARGASPSKRASLAEGEVMVDWLPLHVAIVFGKYRTAGVLIAAEHEAGKSRSWNELAKTAGGLRHTALHLAVTVGSPGLVAAMIEAHACPNLAAHCPPGAAQGPGRLHDGDTPVHLAARLSDLDCLEALFGEDLLPAERLLYRRPRPDIRNAAGQTALHVAAQGQDPDVVAHLIAHGYNAQALDGAGQTPWAVAAAAKEAADRAQALTAAGHHAEVASLLQTLSGSHEPGWKKYIPASWRSAARKVRRVDV